MLEVWFILAIIFIVLEVVLGFTIVLLFAAFASFSVGLLVTLGSLSEDSTVTQISLFFALSAVWTILLWKPLKRMLAKRSESEGVHSYIGQEVVLIDDTLEKGHIGDAKWSGTIRKIKIAEDAKELKYHSGEILKVVAVQDNLFIVKKE